MVDEKSEVPEAYSSASWNAALAPPASQAPSRKLGLPAWGRIGLLLIYICLQVLAIVHRLVSNRQPLESPAWHHSDSVARPDQLHGTGRIYLVQLGPHTDPYTVVDLSEWLREKYSLDTQVLQATTLDPAAWDSSRHLYVAERLDAQIKREHPTLAADPTAWLIGFTDAGMYAASEPGTSNFSLRDQHRAAIISSSDVGGSFLRRAWLRLTTPGYNPKALLRDRLRRILLKDVAILFWHLPLNNDPGSVLQSNLDPSIPTDDLYQSDLDPLRSPWGEVLGDPCIVFTYAAQTALKTSPGPLIRECEHPESANLAQSSLDTPDTPPNTSGERIELRLRFGLLAAKHTDFYLPGPIPIRFERALSNQWHIPQAFGISGSHNYDRYLVSYDGMRHISIATAGSGDSTLGRAPGLLSFLSQNSWVDTDGSGRNLTLRFRDSPQQHYDLTRFNGEVDSYLPCTDAGFCYLNRYRSSHGDVLTMQRDNQRRLLSISGPQDNWLHFQYDPNPETQNRVVAITDSRGRRVLYRYNPQGQLISVTYPSGEVLTYSYDNLQNLISVSAAPSATDPPQVLVTNRYQNGRLGGQTLLDGSVYTYDYVSAGDRDTSAASVRTPDGTIYDLRFGGRIAVIRQRSLTSPPEGSLGPSPGVRTL